MSISDIIKNFDNLSEEQRRYKCMDKLYKIEKKIYDFEQQMFANWDDVSYYFDFIDKEDYFDYMTSTPRFAEMIYIKNILETYLYNLNKSN